MNLFANLMTPLGKDHCMILYYLGIFNFILGLIVALTALMKLFDRKSRSVAVVGLLNAFVLFFMYYLYRISYSICVRSLL